jgi:hypothetical protein
VFAGGQDVRDIQWNAEAADGNRRRLSTGALASGSMETPKHKSPGLEDTTAKIGGGSGMMEPESGHSSSHVRGGSSSRRAVISSSRPAASTEFLDSSQTLSSKIGGAVSLRTSGVQRSSAVAPTELKRAVTRHQSSNTRNYEAALKGVESLSLEVEQRQ